MFKNYFKIAWRNLARNRVFSAINILGLAIGLASCMLISLYVIDELSFDRFNDKADQIVRVYFKGTMQGGKINESNVMPPTAAALKADYPEVLDATRLRLGGSPVLLADDKLFMDDKLTYADANFFQVFTLPFVKGNPKTALKEPNTLVITERMADKYFGTADPIGKIVTFKDWKTTYKVTGIMKEVPENSHFRFDLFASMSSLEEAKSTSWMTSEFFTYLVLTKGYDYKKLEAKLPQAIEKYFGPQLKQGLGMTLTQFREKGNDIGLYLQPLTAIHLHSDFQFDLGSNGDIRYVYMFGAVALIMLLVACINFMNLSTAGASKRAREVGVRKVMGSEKIELVWQFLLESIVLTSIALVLATIFTLIALPLFNSLSGKELTLNWSALPRLLPALLLFGLFVGIFAGSYPAFFLSSFKPISVLKGGSALLNRSTNRKSFGFRSGLVIFQFFISITLIVGTTVVYKQLTFIQNKKLGYEKEQVLLIPGWGLGKNQQTFRNELLLDSRVQRVSLSGFLPAGPSYNNNYMVYGEDNASQLVKTLRYDVDADYIPTLGMAMAAGRNFSRDFGTDSAGVIINETAVKTFGWKGNALNKTLSHRTNEGTVSTYRVIGVVKDFHFRSLHERIAPLVMILSPGEGTFIAKINTADIPGLLATMKGKWESFKPDLPFNYTFLNERFNETFKAEQKTGRILGIFAGLTIFVACLGLFGLATFTAEQRTKEIGIRKALGASVAGIVALLSKDFLKLVLIAIVIATPAAWWLMNRWLMDFEYKISISWWMFVVAGLLSVAVALLTVSFQSIRAALMNPVKSLRSE